MLNGIDIASYQAGLDTSNIEADFVIVKVTQGISYTNPALDQQVRRARQAGKLIALYHYANGADPIAEANYFLDVAKPYINNAALILDYESPANQIWYPQGAYKWLDYVKKQTGKVPLIYMGLSDENHQHWGNNPDYPLWVAQYNNYNNVYGYKPRSIYGSLRHWSRCAIFQYTAAGRLHGWNGNLDFDVFYGTRKDWQYLANSTSSQSPESEDIEMTWHVPVPYNVMGACLVTNYDGAYLYEDNKLSKVIGARDRGTTYKVFGIENGAIKVGTNQYFDGRDVVTKFNPVAYNPEAHGIGQSIATDLYTQNTLGAAKGIKYLPINSRWVTFGRDGKYLKVGNEVTGKYANGDKLYIDL